MYARARACTHLAYLRRPHAHAMTAGATEQTPREHPLLNHAEHDQDAFCVLEIERHMWASASQEISQSVCVVDVVDGGEGPVWVGGC